MPEKTAAEASPPGALTRSAARGRHAGLALAVILSCQLMVILDATVVSIALPDIRRDLEFSATGLSWVLNAYTLAFGGLLLLGGRAGDILGRRRVLVGGIVVFTVASLLGGVATTAGLLVAARVLQGAGAALAAPSTLALITTNFAEGQERHRAIALYSAVSGSGAALGLIVGGLLTDWASWRWVLFINLPFGLAVLLLAPRYVRESDRHPGRFDLAGALTSTAGMAALVYALIRVSSDGWRDGLALATFAVAAVLLAAFPVVELRARQPITPLRLFGDRDRTGGFVAMLLFPAAMFGMFFFMTQFLQEVLGFSPIEAGLGFLPLALLIVVSGGAAAKLVPKAGIKPLLVAGSALVIAGMVWLTRISAGSDYATGVLGPMVLFGVGAGLCFMTLTAMILSGVRPEDSGAASGLLQAMQQVGGTLGLSVLVTVFGTASRKAAEDPPAGLNPGALTRHVMAEGMSTAFIASTAFIICVLLIALTLRRER